MSDWELSATDRNNWRKVCSNSIHSFEEARLDFMKVRRQERKEANSRSVNPLWSTCTCDTCKCVCHWRTGLYTLQSIIDETCRVDSVHECLCVPVQLQKYDQPEKLSRQWDSDINMTHCRSCLADGRCELCRLTTSPHTWWTCTQWHHNNNNNNMAMFGSDYCLYLLHVFHCFEAVLLNHLFSVCALPLFKLRCLHS